jgi:hypothetical protein
MTVLAGGVPAAAASDLVWAPIAAALVALLGFLPALIGALLLLLIGWLLAGWLARLLATLLERVGFGSAVERTGLVRFLAGRRTRSGRPYTASWLIADVVRWFIFLVFAIAALQTLSLSQLNSLLASALLFLPRLLVALLVLLFGAILASFLAGLVRGAAARGGFGNPGWLGTVARWSILAFAVVVAVDQVGIAKDLVDILFTAVVVMVALTAGIAFGLGGQDMAAEVWERWYQGLQGRNRTQ